MKVLAAVFVILLLCALVLLATAGHRLSSGAAWAGLSLVAATVAAAVFVGWPIL